MRILCIKAALVLVFGTTFALSIFAQSPTVPTTPPKANASASPSASPQKTTAAAKPAADPLKGLKKERDNMKGNTWYHHPSSPKHRNANAMYLYFGKTDSGIFTPLRMVIQYSGDSWLFVRKAWAKADGVEILIPQEAHEITGWERDHDGGGIWEWSDTVVLSAEKLDVRALANAKKVTVRFEGRQYYNDRNISTRQLKAMQEVISAYEAATGKPW